MLSRTFLSHWWSVPSFETRFWQRWYFFCGIALLIFTGTKILFPPAAKIAEVFVWLGACPLCFRNHYLQRSQWKWLALGCVIVQLLSWGSAYLSHPAWASHWPTFDRLGKLFFFMPVGLILAGKFSNVVKCWSVYALGLFLFILFNRADWPNLAELANGDRVDFGIRNAQHTAMYFGVLVLILLVFVKRWISHPSKLFPFSRIILFCVLLFSIFALYITQTRAILLGALLALFGCCIHFLFGRLSSSWSRSRLLLGSFLVIGILAGGGYTASHIIEQRNDGEQQTVSLLLDGDIEQLPYTSIGIRIHTWLVAFHAIEERPFLGWGDKARSMVIKTSNTLPEEIREDFGHLHNYFIEIQLSYGLLGSLFLLYFFFYITKELYISSKSQLIGQDAGILSLAFIAYWLFINNFESYMSFNTGIFIMGIVFGGLTTQRMYDKEFL